MTVVAVEARDEVARVASRPALAVEGSPPVVVVAVGTATSAVDFLNTVEAMAVVTVEPVDPGVAAVRTVAGGPALAVEGGPPVHVSGASR